MIDKEQPDHNKKIAQTNALNNKFKFEWWMALVLVVIIVVVGIVVIRLSRASTVSSSFQAEDAQLQADCAKIFDDSLASNLKAVSLDCAAVVETPGFVHPGILVDKTQLDFVKAKILAGQEPWLSAFNKAKSSYLGSKSYVAKPVAIVQCSQGSYTTTYPQSGCVAQNQDAVAAYNQALLWYYTGDATYANKSIEIMNAWASTLTEIKFDQPRDVNGVATYGGTTGTRIYANGMLQGGWSAQNLTRAAEIMRYTYKSPTTGGWSEADIAKMENNLKTVHYPLNKNGWTAGGNWETTFAEAMTNIGIFSNDTTIYNQGLNYWRKIAPSLIYLKSDGAIPKSPSATYTTASAITNLWNNPTSFIDGLSEETCRDLGHTMMGLGGLSDTAETARIQGVDLYGEQQNRFIAGYELNTGYINQMLDQMAATGQTASQVTASTWKPSTNFVCPDFKDGGASAFLGLELAYNHFATGKGISMPNTKALIERSRPTGAGNHLVFETLTHAGTGISAVAPPKPPSFGSFTAQVTVPNTASYRLWVRLKSPIAANDAVQAQVDADTPIRLGDAPVTPNAWTWIDYKNGDTASKSDLSLTTGLHTIKITGIESGVKVDRVMVAAAGCIPSGLGDNCATIAPVIVPDTIAPTAPAGLIGSAVSGTDINISWTASVDSVGVTGYQVFRHNQEIAAVTATTYSDTDLTPGQTYSYTVKAKDQAGNISSSSNVLTLTTVADVAVTPAPVTPAPVSDTTSPSMPANFNAKLIVALGYPVDLSWSASSDNVSVRGYNVYKAGVKVATTSSLQYRDPTITAGGSIKYGVEAFDSSGNVSQRASYILKTSCFLFFCRKY